jgi:hypothetical protein
LVGSVRTWEETMAEHPKLLVRLEPQRFYDMTLQGRGLTPLAMESRNDQKFQKGHLIISNALVHLTQNQLQQLPLALVDPQDASGGTLAKAALFILGYRGPHFPKITYLGRHDKVLYAVANAEYGIGAVNDHVFQRYYRPKQIVSLTQFPVPGAIWATTAAVPEAWVLALPRLLNLALNAQTSTSLEITRFFPFVATDLDIMAGAQGPAKAFEQAKEP